MLANGSGGICNILRLLARYLFTNLHDEIVVSKFRKVKNALKHYELSTPCQDEISVLNYLIKTVDGENIQSLELTDKELLLVELSELVADPTLIDELKENLSSNEIAFADKILQYIELFAGLERIVLYSIQKLSSLADKIEKQAIIDKDSLRELLTEYNKILQELNKQKIRLTVSEKQKEEAHSNTVIVDLNSVQSISDRLQNLMEATIPYIPTYPEFDRWMFGGIYPQTATLFVAPVNHGKTSIMLNLISRFFQLAKQYPFDTTRTIIEFKLYTDYGKVPDEFKIFLQKINKLTPELQLQKLMEVAQKKVFNGRKPAIVYIGFESNIDLLMLKFFSILLGKKISEPSKWLKNMNIEEFTQAVTNYLKNLAQQTLYLVPIFKRAPKHGYTVDDIWYYLDSLKQDGYEPLMVFIDYLAYLKPTREGKNSSSFDKETQVVNELYSLTETVPIISAVQTKKSFLDPTYADINNITLDSVKGFGRALEIFDTIFAAIRIPKDHTVVFKVLKARDVHIAFNEQFLMRYNSENYKLLTNINLKEHGVNPYSPEYRLWLEQNYYKLVHTPNLDDKQKRTSKFGLDLIATPEVADDLMSDLLKDTKNKSGSELNLDELINNDFDILKKSLEEENDNDSAIVL